MAFENEKEDSLELEFEIEEVEEMEVDEEVEADEPELEIETEEADEEVEADEPELEIETEEADEEVEADEPELEFEDEIEIPKEEEEPQLKLDAVVKPKGMTPREQQARFRNTMAMVGYGVGALVAIVLLIILLPYALGKDKETQGNVSNDGMNQQTTVAVADDNGVEGDEADGTEADGTQQATEMVAETQTQLVTDTVAPVISGVKNKTFNIGDVVMYLSGITAMDDVDGEVEVKVDKSEVNVNKAGSYKVKYSATDKAGNIAKAEATFTFKVYVADGATYQDMAKQLLNQLTNSSMSQGQKLKAIYDYIYANVRYTQQRVPGGTWQQESAVGLKELLTTGTTNGNCITYASLCMAMLEAAGAQTIWMDNSNSKADSYHVWVLCNVGTGWYHFDATRYVRGGKRFMCTDAQLSTWMNETGFKRYYWDTSACPATATEPYTY